MDFDLSPVQRSWQSKGGALGRDTAADPAAAAVIMGAARVGLLDAGADLPAVVAAAAAMASESPTAAAVFALHSGAALAVAGDARFVALFRGETVAAVELSAGDVVVRAGRLCGRAAWVAPITNRGVAVVGSRDGEERGACAVALDAAGAAVERVTTAGLAGLVCGHVTFTDTDCMPLGPTVPIMARIRVLMAAVGLGIGRRALREALATARAAHTAAAGEQTVQGLLADAATELDAAMLMTWRAAVAGRLSLADASLAKLAATGAAQRAVDRATQVVGADSFRGGHIIERLARDVRALELFAGRTEALRDAVAEEILPHTS